MNIVLSKRAERDLDDIWEYIATRDVETANRVQDELYAEIASLGVTPQKGHTRQDVQDKRLRFWVKYSYVIAYRVRGPRLTVVRIVHGARDLRRIFR